MKKLITGSLLGLVSLVLVACGEKQGEEAVTQDITQEKLDY
ncbi:MAG: FMN-binding protein, partial [Alphaproteobacteria bacterium]